MAKTQGTLGARGNDVIGKILKPRCIGISALVRRQRHQRNPEESATPSKPGMVEEAGSRALLSRFSIDRIYVKFCQHFRSLATGVVLFEAGPSRQRNTDAGPAVGDAGIRDGGEF